MLIQNINGVAPVAGFTSSTSGPAPATSPSTQNVSAMPPQGTPTLPQTIQPTDAQLKSAVDSINNTMKQNNSNVEFSIEKGSNQAVIKVVDTQTGQLISRSRQSLPWRSRKWLHNHNPVLWLSRRLRIFSASSIFVNKTDRFEF